MLKATGTVLPEKLLFKHDVILPTGINNNIVLFGLCSLKPIAILKFTEAVVNLSFPKVRAK